MPTRGLFTYWPASSRLSRSTVPLESPRDRLDRPGPRATDREVDTTFRTNPLQSQRVRSARMSNHLCHVFSMFGLGGAEVRTAAIINAAGRSYRHTIISIKGDLSCSDKIAPSAAVSYRPVR